MTMGEAPLTPEARERLAFLEIESRYVTIRTGLRVGGVLGVAYFLFRSIEAIAGQATSLSIIISLILNAFFELKFAFAVTLAGGCAVWAIAERMLRHRKVANLSGRIKELEQSIDPNRTSSGLTKHGKTNPRDKGK